MTFLSCNHKVYIEQEKQNKITLWSIFNEEKHHRAGQRLSPLLKEITMSLSSYQTKVHRKSSVQTDDMQYQ